jgi:hypothetical protein
MRGEESRFEVQIQIPEPGLEAILAASGFDVRFESWQRFPDGRSEVRALLRFEEIARLVRRGFAVLVLKELLPGAGPRAASPAEAAAIIAASLEP